MKIGNGDWYTGDCFEVMATLPDQSVDMVLTDIPYAEVNRRSGGLRNLDKGAADTPTLSLKEIAGEVSRVCAGSAYVFCGFKQISELATLMENAGFSIRVATWHKSNPSPMNGQRMWLSGLEFCVFGRKKGAVFNEHCKPAIWKFASQQSKIHPTQKPVKLFEYLVGVSTNEGGIVLDCFAGSGTTAIAAENANRRWICIERDEGYSAAAQKRIADHIAARGMPVKALRPHQTKAIEMLRDSIRTGHKAPVLQLSTGAGKTLIAADNRHPDSKSRLDYGTDGGRGMKVCKECAWRELALRAIDALKEAEWDSYSTLPDELQSEANRLDVKAELDR